MKKEDLRIVFMGTPEFAVPTLDRLVTEGYNVVGVVTQPDRPVGRHQNKLQPSEIKQFAVSHNIPVLQPEKMKNPEFVEQLRSWKADLQIVVAFRMLPEVVWDMPRFGTFNVHAALLPQYRGAAPINWAVINGETETGVTTFFLDKNIDTGRIIGQKRFPIPDDANVEYVYDGLMALGADLCIETVEKILAHDGQVESIDQAQLVNADDQILHPAPKIFKETCEINWNQPQKKVYDFIRGLSPYPGAWTTLDDKQTIKIFEAKKTDMLTNGAAPGSIMKQKHRLFIACEDGWLEITELQLSGKPRRSAADFLNGHQQIDDHHVLFPARPQD